MSQACLRTACVASCFAYQPPVCGRILTYSRLDPHSPLLACANRQCVSQSSHDGPGPFIPSPATHADRRRVSQSSHDGPRGRRTGHLRPSNPSSCESILTHSRFYSSIRRFRPAQTVSARGNPHTLTPRPSGSLPPMHSARRRLSESSHDGPRGRRTGHLRQSNPSSCEPILTH